MRTKLDEIVEEAMLRWPTSPNATWDRCKEWVDGIAERAFRLVACGMLLNMFDDLKRP